MILCTRPMSDALVDRIGYRRVFMPCLVLIAAGLSLLMVRGTRTSLVASAIVFGVGFGTTYPVFVAYLMKDVDPRRGVRRDSHHVRHRHRHRIDDRRLAHRALGFSDAFGVAAALPYFLVADKRRRASV